MVMNGITNLLVWAHILSPTGEPVAPARPVIEDIVVKAHHHKESSKPAQNNQNQTQVISKAKDLGPLVPVTEHLKVCVQQITKAFPEYLWTKENKALIARIARTSQESYKNIEGLIQECLKCVSVQKNDRARRIMYSNFELCKRDLRKKRLIALFAQSHRIKSKK